MLPSRPTRAPEACGHCPPGTQELLIYLQPRGRPYACPRPCYSSPFWHILHVPLPFPISPLVGPGTLGGRTDFLFLALLFGFVIRVAQRGSVTCPPSPHSRAEPAVGSRYPPSGAASVGGIGQGWVLGPLLSMVWARHSVCGPIGPHAASH